MRPSARARAAKLLAGLGFDRLSIEKPVSQFSGGWRRRIALASALMSRSAVLLLDEPTNHLDLDAVLWLEEWLAEYPGLLLVVAHDREFLDRIVNKIVSIEQARVTLHTGNYSAFESRRAGRLAQQQAAYLRQQRELRQVMDFVQRFRAKATKAAQAQSRLKALERMERIAPAHADSPFTFAFPEPEKLPRPLLTLDRAAVGYGERVVIENIEFSVSPGDRIGLLGRNGAGKSTFTRALAGGSPLLGGQRVAAQDLGVGYFAQHQLEQLDPNASPLEHLKRLGGPALARGTEEEQRTYLGGFGFSGDRVFEPVAPFSGGEKARLVLSLIVSQRPNLLLLDEPTNHLDLEMRHALSMALQSYSGAIVLVSHDRHLLRLVTDVFWLVADGRAGPYDGDLDDYAQWLRRSDPEPEETVSQATTTDRDRKRSEAQRRQRLSPLKAAVTRCEQRLQALGAEASALEAKLAAGDLYVAEAKATLKETLARAADIKRQLAEAEEDWLRAAEALEVAEQAP